MDYILEEFGIQSERVSRNILVKDNRIAYISDRPLRMSTTRVHLKGYELVPSYVMADFTLYEKAVDGSLREATEQLIELGCTTVLTVFPIYYERDFEEKLAKFRENLTESSVDYVIGLTIPIQKLTPSIIRICQREKLAFIVIEIDHPKDYRHIIWEWIRDANFPYQVQLIPSWDKSKFEGKKKKQIVQHFYSLVDEKELDFIHEELTEKTPLELNFLKYIGVYPQKGDLLTGGELDYLLFWDNSPGERRNRAKSQVSEEDTKPSVVVKDGSIVFSEGFLKESKGKEIIIKRPSIFKSLF